MILIRSGCYDVAMVARAKSLAGKRLLIACLASLNRAMKKAPEDRGLLNLIDELNGSPSRVPNFSLYDVAKKESWIFCYAI